MHFMGCAEYVHEVQEQDFSMSFFCTSSCGWADGRKLFHVCRLRLVSCGQLIKEKRAAFLTHQFFFLVKLLRQSQHVERIQYDSVLNVEIQLFFHRSHLWSCTAWTHTKISGKVGKLTNVRGTELHCDFNRWKRIENFAGFSVEANTLKWSFYLMSLPNVKVMRPILVTWELAMHGSVLSNGSWPGCSLSLMSYPSIGD